MIIFPGKNINEPELSHLLTCSDNRIALIDKLHNFKIDEVRTDAYACLLCTNGTASAIMNNIPYHVGKEDFMICRPNTILEKTMFSADFEFRGLILTTTFTNEFSMVFKEGWDILPHHEASPILKLTQDECMVFIKYWELMYEKLTTKHSKHHNEVMTSILLALAYELYDSTEQFREKDKVNIYSSAENLYQRFMELLLSTNPKEREVVYYASKLCVTPKYLSTVCKNVSGETASQIIYKYVINDVKHLLVRRDLSIKDIASKMGFDNLSFFGKYTKRALGMSPKAYRQQNINE